MYELYHLLVCDLCCGDVVLKNVSKSSLKLIVFLKPHSLLEPTYPASCHGQFQLNTFVFSLITAFLRRGNYTIFFTNFFHCIRQVKLPLIKQVSVTFIHPSLLVQ